MSSTALTTVKDKIIAARVSLLLTQPFFGSLATRLVIKESNTWCATAATDGRHIFYNTEFFSPMTIKEIEFVIAHEILHNVFDHMGRMQSRNPTIHNIACDYAVNGQLIRDSIGVVPSGVAGNIFHDKKYYGLSSEEIYDILITDFDEQSLSALGKLVDEHPEWGKRPGDDGAAGKPTYSNDELRQIRDEMVEATLQAAQAAQAAGKLPAEIARLIKEMTTSKIDWRTMLRQQIQSTVKNDFSFMRPNRKAQHLSAIIPGSNYDTTIDICVALDMSGSITNEQAATFMSEIKGIMDEYRDFKIKVFSFDTKVYNERDFDEFSMDTFMDYEPVGGGGTDFECVWEYMHDTGYVPNRLLMFTDMYPCGKWCPPGMEDYCETLFIGHGTTSIIPPFGEYTYFDEH